MSSYKILNFYKFIELDALEELKEAHYQEAFRYNLIGSIYVAAEGVNVALAGSDWGLDQYMAFVRRDPRLADVVPKFSRGQVKPFRNLCAKVKPSIIRFDEGVELSVDEICDGARLSPQEVHRLIKESPQEAVLVDTRNWYETDYGTFAGAQTLPIKKFTQFTQAFLERYGNQKELKFVFFCTGGVRCEKVVPWARRAGFQQAFQLDGGILKYFEEFGGDGFDGQCFVFDHRWILDGSLNEAQDEQMHLRIQPKPLSCQKRG